jgi:hypothetical protein
MARLRQTLFVGKSEAGRGGETSHDALFCRSVQPARILLLAGLVAIASLPRASANEWKELPYNPPVGSKWIFQSQQDEEDNRPEGLRTTQTKSRGELTIDAKTATGFKVTYVVRDISIGGNAPAIEIIKPVVGVLKDNVIHATLDAGGKAVSVDNLDEAKASMREFIDRTFKSFDSQPKIVAVLRPMFDNMLNASGVEAAKAYLTDVISLSHGQNTGLKLGEMRHESSETANPLGGGAPIKIATATHIERVDAASGIDIVVSESQTDPEGMKDFALEMIKRLGIATDRPMPPNVAEMIKGMTMTINDKTTIQVEAGMARMLRTESLMSLSAMGHTLTKKTVETIIVTKAQ